MLKCEIIKLLLRWKMQRTLKASITINCVLHLVHFMAVALFRVARVAANNESFSVRMLPKKIVYVDSRQRGSSLDFGHIFRLEWKGRWAPGEDGCPQRRCHAPQRRWFLQKAPAGCSGYQSPCAARCHPAGWGTGAHRHDSLKVKQYHPYQQCTQQCLYLLLLHIWQTLLSKTTNTA